MSDVWKKESLAYNELFISLSLSLFLSVSAIPFPLSLCLPLSIHSISVGHYWHDRGIVASPELLETDTFLKKNHIIAVTGSPLPMSSPLFCQRVITSASERTRSPLLPFLFPFSLSSTKAFSPSVVHLRHLTVILEQCVPLDLHKLPNCTLKLVAFSLMK